ncbi:MAG: hypothetical protein E7384_08355 [Ruminococcaceae bacterium]|nr:hypothetical protein [Oscillospiraceae bacterium]
MKRLKKILALVFVIALLVNNFAGVTTVSAEKIPLVVEVNLNGIDLMEINIPRSFKLSPYMSYYPFDIYWDEADIDEGPFVVLSKDNYVCIGDYDFSNVNKIVITYRTDSAFSAESLVTSGEKYAVGLSSVAGSFGTDTNVPDFSSAIVKTTVETGSGSWTEEKTLTITNNIDTSYNGEVWLTNYATNDQAIMISGITLYYDEYVKANVYVEESLFGKTTLSHSGMVDIGEVVTVITEPDEKYEVDYITLNGGIIDENSFTVRGDTVIRVNYVRKLQFYDGYDTEFNVTDVDPTAVYAGSVNLFTSASNGNRYSYATGACAVLCSYDSDKNAYIVESFSRGGGNSYLELELTENQILLWIGMNDKNTQKAFTYLNVGTYMYLEGVDLVNKSVSDGALAGFLNKYTATVEQAEHGTFSIKNPEPAPYATEIYLEAKPEPGYKVGGYCVNGERIEGHSFKITQDSVVSAVFVGDNTPDGLDYYISDNEVIVKDYFGSGTELKIPETIEGYPVTTLDMNSLRSCHTLERIFLPKTIKSIHQIALISTSKLLSISVDKENEYFSSVDGVLYTSDLTKLVKYPDNKADSYFVVPDGVTELGYCSFMYTYNLTALSLPKSLKIIGDAAFYYDNITDVYYKGTEAEWADVEIVRGVPQLANATIHYNCAFSLADSLDININSNTGFITEFGFGKTFAELKGMFSDTANIRFTDSKGNTPESTDIVGTGFTVELFCDDFVVEKISVVLSGDTDGDGAVTIADTMVAYNHLRGKAKVDGAYAEAAKASGGDNMSIIDVMTILNMI